MSVHLRAPVGTLAVGAKLDRYEILARLAAGGMATVYVARVQAVAGFERLVAIKVLHSNLAHEDEFIRMFLDEARLAASIRHPNVVPTIDVSDSKEAGCGYFIVMEYIEGDHLGALLSSAHKAGEKLALPVVLRMLADALGGLGAAHDLCDDAGRSLNLVHRDVSPHNILVGRDGVVRLTDFGVAKAEDRLTHTREGQVKGKLAYMAPEQAGSGATDARSDLFSVGVVLWECITGRRLFRADTSAGTLNKLLREPVPAPSSIDPALAPLDALLAKALAREPAERFQSADEFAQAIEEVAPAVGGLASLRGVARTVKHHAAAKLKREKKLVDEALRALRPHDEEVATETADELTQPSSTDISVVSSSLSASKLSGVFSHHTQPGGTWLTKARTEFSTGSSQAISAARDSLVQALAGAGTARGRPGTGKAAHLVRAVLLVLCGGVAIAAYYLAFSRGPTTRADNVHVVPPAAEQATVVAPAKLDESAVSNASEPAVSPRHEAPVIPVAVQQPSASTDTHTLQVVEPRKAIRSRAERSARTGARASRRTRKDATANRKASEESLEAVPPSDEVMPNPYHSR